MLFNSYEFILLFLPAALIIYYALFKYFKYRAAISWLVAASLFFYAWWNPAYLGLIITSMLFNYTVGVSLSEGKKNKWLLVFGVAINLGALGYFKYANFFVDNINRLIKEDINIAPIILPLAISFFTFQQIAFLVDAYRGETKEYNFLQYALFVTFFPQLIAGPIVHHGEMLPQFSKHIEKQVNSKNLALGVTVFFIGLFKKVGIADQIAEYVSPVFDAASNGAALTLLESWGGALAYTLQLYFDFSGYVDMAIGSALMFGIRLPINFNSPYKAINIIDFWRRWHMTLSRFLRDYLYIALGGNRRGYIRKKVNLALTMLLGGMWHGAGWTFIVWGGLHGIYLIVNHLWRESVGKIIPGWLNDSAFTRFIYGTVTFLAVVVGWVFFRAENIEAAAAILLGMSGSNGLEIPIKYQERWGDLSVFIVAMGGRFEDSLFEGGTQIKETIIFLLAVWFLPNTQEIMGKYNIAMGVEKRPTKWSFEFNWLWLGFIYVIGVASILKLGQISEFLYFQF